MMTGSTSGLPHWHERSISDQGLESSCWPTSTARRSRLVAKDHTTKLQVASSSDGDSSNSKSSRSSRRDARLTNWRSTAESSQRKAQRILTELPPKLPWLKRERALPDPMEYLKTVTVFFEEAIHRPLSFIILMRFILIYKYGFFQRRTERLDVANCASTNQIIEMLARKLQKS